MELDRESLQDASESGEHLWRNPRWVGKEKRNNADDKFLLSRKTADAVIGGEGNVAKETQIVASATLSSKPRIPVVFIDLGATAGDFGCVP